MDDLVFNAFNNPNHIFNPDAQYNLTGSSKDDSIGEHIVLHLYIHANRLYGESKILRADFSAIGTPFLIACAERFCDEIENHTFNGAIEYCLFDDKFCGLAIPEQKVHDINLIIQAFFMALETLSNK